MGLVDVVCCSLNTEIYDVEVTIYGYSSPTAKDEEKEIGWEGIGRPTSF